jgi:PAS domain S-box-containing protein
MKVGKDKNPSPAAELRRRAEEQLRTKTTGLQPPKNEEESQRLVHGLEVHQIELEMQNDELKNARDKAERLLDKYTDLYDFAPVGYYTLDHIGTILEVNLSGARLLGIERSLLPGRRFELCVANEARLFFSEFLGKVFAGQKKRSCEIMLTSERNLPIFVQIEAVAFASGQECRIAVIDITERRQAEKVIEKLNFDLTARAADLEEANLVLEAFNYSVAHDLRQPLNVVSSYCQAIKELCGANLDEQCRRYLQEAYDGTLRMNRMIEALLNFSRLTHIQLNSKNVDLSSMAREVAVELKGTEAARRVEIRIANGIGASGDADLLRVVLNNLFDNAWKFTGMRDEAIIEFGMKEINGNLVYFVRDNGAGFDNAYADKLFLPFQRLPGSEEYRGFGIGLATVERIIKRHGGRVWVVGEPGKGATFNFTLQA